MTVLPELESELEQVRQLLFDGLDRLRRDGWCKNSWTTETGQCCALGAMGMNAYASTPSALDATMYLARAVREQKNLRPRYPEDWRANRVVIRFNDARTRKFQDVEAIYLRAIEMVEADITEAQRG